jgi:hypothetical protein
MRLSQTWSSSGHMAHPLGPPLSLLTPSPAANPGHSPRALQGCLPVRRTAVGPVRSGQERPRVQPGRRHHVVGVAPPLGSAAHLGGQGRVLGSRPARGALPILQRSGHCLPPGVLGVMGHPASGWKGIRQRKPRCPTGQPELPAGAVDSPPALAARRLRRAPVQSARRRGRGGGGGGGWGEGGAAGGWGPRGAARSGGGGEGARALGRPRAWPWTLGGAGVGPRPPARSHASDAGYWCSHRHLSRWALVHAAEPRVRAAPAPPETQKSRAGAVAEPAPAGGALESGQH